MSFRPIQIDAAEYDISCVVNLANVRVASLIDEDYIARRQDIYYSCLFTVQTDFHIGMPSTLLNAKPEPSALRPLPPKKSLFQLTMTPPPVNCPPNAHQYHHCARFERSPFSVQTTTRWTFSDDDGEGRVGNGCASPIPNKVCRLLLKQQLC
jgi:hypothetical protein